MAWIFLISLVGGTLLFGPGFVAAIVASKKGYRPWFWLFSAGPFGALLIMLKPGLSQAKTPEERERWESAMDRSGAILSGFTLLFMFAITAIIMLGFFSYRVVRVPPAPVVVVPVQVISPPPKEVPEDAKVEESPDHSDK